jgi:hypothetical protein
LPLGQPLWIWVFVRGTSADRTNALNLAEAMPAMMRNAPVIGRSERLHVSFRESREKEFQPGERNAGAVGRGGTDPLSTSERHPTIVARVIVEAPDRRYQPVPMTRHTLHARWRSAKVIADMNYGCAMSEAEVHWNDVGVAHGTPSADSDGGTRYGCFAIDRGVAFRSSRC